MAFVMLTTENYDKYTLIFFINLQHKLLKNRVLYIKIKNNLPLKFNSIHFICNLALLMKN